MTPSKAPVAYIAGPLTTHGDVQRNRANAVRVARMVVQNGMTPIVPHFFLELDEPPQPYEFWMGACLALLERCDLAFFLPKWQASKGCRIEHAFCRERGIRIIYLDAITLDNDPPESLEQPPSA